MDQDRLVTATRNLQETVRDLMERVHLDGSSPRKIGPSFAEQKFQKAFAEATKAFSQDSR